MCSLLAAALVTSAATGAGAQSADAWQVTVVPYMMGASMSGTTAVGGQELDIDMSASDIFSNLQFGAMGLVVARKGSWGVGGDALWMSLGANGTAPGPLGVTGSADMSQGGFAFYGLRRLGAAADLVFGGRVNYLSANLRLNAPLELGYRWLDIDYETGDDATLFKYDVLTQGPMAGFAFRF